MSRSDICELRMRHRTREASDLMSGLRQQNATIGLQLSPVSLTQGARHHYLQVIEAICALTLRSREGKGPLQWQFV